MAISVLFQSSSSLFLIILVKNNVRCPDHIIFSKGNLNLNQQTSTPSENWLVLSCIVSLCPVNFHSWNETVAYEYFLSKKRHIEGSIFFGNRRLSLIPIQNIQFYSRYLLQIFANMMTLFVNKQSFSVCQIYLKRCSSKCTCLGYKYHSDFRPFFFFILVNPLAG